MRTPNQARLILAMSLVLASALTFAAPIKRAQFPALSPDGRSLVFCWQGDLWLVPAEGGTASRLTVHPATDMLPRFTPDGTRIVFSSNRYGSIDLFSMTTTGGDIKRLTHDSSTELTWSISADSKWLYGYTNLWGRQDVFKLLLEGGDMIRLSGHPLEVEYTPSVSADGSKVYLMAGAPLNWRKPAAKGTYTGDIWVADDTTPLSNWKNLTRNDSNEMFPQVLPNGKVLFVSNRSGWPNVWLMNGDGSGAKQLTRHQDGTVRYLSVSADGRTAAYEFASGIYVLDIAKAETAEVQIEVPADQRLNPVLSPTLTSGVSDYDVSPDGKRAVLSIRGDIYLIPERGGTTRQLTSHPALDYQPRWIDNSTVVFTTARTGKRELMTVSITGQEKPFVSDLRDVCNPALSPDRKLIAFHRGTNEICSIPAIGGSISTLARGYFEDALGGDSSFSWSADSKHIAAALVTERGGTDIQVIAIDTGKATKVARLARFMGSPPKFLPNGRGIYFTANEYEDTDLFVVDLIQDDLTFTEDDLDKIDAPKENKPAESTVQIHEPGIFERMRRLTMQGASSPQATADGRSIWVTVLGQVVAIPVRGGAATPVSGVTGPASQVKITSGKTYFLAQGRLFSYNPQSGPAPIGFSANPKLNLKSEEMALFEEIWWALDRMYYDEKHHGTDWARIKRKYAEYVPQCFDRTDFYALMGEMMEELNSSHLGSTPPPGDPPQTTESTGYLGVEWNPAELERGRYVVQRVYLGTPASHPQSLLMSGDRLITVNGMEPGTGAPLSSLLAGTDGKKTVLKIQRASKDLEILIKPTSLATRTGVMYEDWVKWQREQVESLSGGKLTYMHIEGMNEPSHNQFLRELRSLTPGKKGVIIDVRFNGGGSTSHLALGVLLKQTWLIRTFRGTDLKLSENINRGDSLELPSALMCNQQSFSNAEMFAEGFKRLKIGPVIGVETAGGVISTGAMQLWDGGSIRMPIRGAYAMDGENLERNGRKPDVSVPFDPNAWLQGRDTQLERAVEVMLQRLR